MSSSTALALIIASTLAGLYCFQYISNLANEVAAEVITGVVRGNPVPTKWRWLMLHQQWVPYAASAMACGAAVAAVNVTIADHATDAGVKPLAYLIAFLGAVAALGWVLTGVSEFIYFRSVLRQAEAD